MDTYRSSRGAVVCLLVKDMRDKGSWAGETHVQKSTLFLQEMLGVQMGYRFALHLHGPYSFDLSEELAHMQAIRVLRTEPRPGYGASFNLGKWGKNAIAAFKDGEQEREQKRLDDAIAFVAERISRRNTRALERISTAFFLKKKYPKKTDSEIAELINRLKPHISVKASLDAIDEVKRLKADAAGLVPQAIVE